MQWAELFFKWIRERCGKALLVIASLRLQTIVIAVAVSSRFVSLSFFSARIARSTKTEFPKNRDKAAFELFLSSSDALIRELTKTTAAFASATVSYVPSSIRIETRESVERRWWDFSRPKEPSV